MRMSASLGWLGEQRWLAGTQEGIFQHVKNILKVVSRDAHTGPEFY